MCHLLNLICNFITAMEWWCKNEKSKSRSYRKQINATKTVLQCQKKPQGHRNVNQARSRSHWYKWSQVKVTIA